MIPGKIEFRLNVAAIQNSGYANLTTFCEKNDIDRNLLNHIRGKSYARPGTKSEKLVEMLIRKGYGEYVEVARETA